MNSSYLPAERATCLQGKDTFGRRICARRHALPEPMTQQQLASRLNVSRPAVTQWETGRSMPAAARLSDLADALHCTVNDLFPPASPVKEDKP